MLAARSEADADGCGAMVQPDARGIGGSDVERVLTIPIAGAAIHARQWGDEPRAIFLHGFGSDLHTWDGVWSELAGALPALRYDLRGFGQSVSSDDAPFNHADDLRAILDAKNIEQCDLVGVSMGGGIALNFTLDHSDRVRNLILVSPSLVAWEWSEDWRRLWRPIVSKARAGAIDEARHLWWQHPLFATTRSSAAGQALFESIMRFSGTQWIRDEHQSMLPDVDRLCLLRTRTLLLTGGRDLEDFAVIASLIEAGARDIARIHQPEAGHLLHLEDAAGCAHHILSFLDSGSERQAGAQDISRSDSP
jgi:pimeloyl-ACP methyl ester carboxylesterase